MGKSTRRDVLRLGSIGIAAGLAGCSSQQRFPEVGDETRENRTVNCPPNANRGSADTGLFSTETLDRAQSMAREARHAVVKVSTRGSGTGWVLDGERGHIVTNAHVVGKSEFATIETFDGGTAEATVVGAERDLIPDLALLETDFEGPPSLPTGDGTALARGDPLVAIGHPGTVGDWITTIGRFEATTNEWILSTTPTSQGNSGGPLLTLEGTVVGVVSGSTTRRGDRDDYSKSDEVYATLPSSQELTTAELIANLRELLEEWR